MADNKNSYNPGFGENSFEFYPDFDTLEKAPPKKAETTVQPVKEEVVNDIPVAETSEIKVESIPDVSENVVPTIEDKPESQLATKKVSRSFAVICAVLIIAIIASTTLSVLSFAGFFKSDKDGTVDTSEVAENAYTSMIAKYETAKFPMNINTELAKLYAANNDVVGWLYIPGTAVNTPIVQTNDNSKYLRKNFFGSYTTYGMAYADSRCNKESLSRNTVIYSHNLFNGTHFYDVERYSDIEWYKQHPVIKYETLNASYTFLIYTAFYSTGSATKFNGGYFFNYIFPNMGPQTFKGYIKQLDYRAIYNTGIGLNANDKIITLSTCTHDLDSACGQDIDGRLVVVGRLLRDGENPEVDTSKAKENANYLRPLVWYNKNGKKMPYADSTTWVASEK